MTSVMVENISERKICEMATGTNLMLRASIVLGMVAAVVTIIYLTPYPDQNFKSCDRPCHTLDWPMICRIKLYIEYIPSNIICQDCNQNTSTCVKSYCDNSDNQKGIILANRQLPAPAIQVCHNDILVVDVINNIPSYGLTVHWRGQPNNEAPFMDGVPMITQCAIPSFTTFQYKFRASSPGTHYYHAFSDRDRNRGLFGALVVREANKVDPHRKLYDEDLKEHLIMISEHVDGNGKVEGLLINGKGSSNTDSVEVFHIDQGKRYRLRTVYAAGSLTCPVLLTLEGHSLTTISLDGNPVQPHEFSSVALSKGERMDFVVNAMQNQGSYVLRVISECNKTITGSALFYYHGSTNLKDRLLLRRTGKKLERLQSEEEPGHFNFEDLKNFHEIPEELRTAEVDHKFYLGYDYKYYENNTIAGIRNSRFKMYRINNITFTFPPSPILTQPEDIPPSVICNEQNIPKRCQGKSICECVHINNVPLGSTVEIIIFDKGSDQDEHIFHLHGNHFYIVGTKTFNKPMSRWEVEQLDSRNALIERNFEKPIRKDTIRIPKNGLAVIRFHAMNAGTHLCFWMLRDEYSKGWSRGLDINFQVGGIANVVATPTGFPTCGNFIGPEFFLL